jgi:hypothetical protein
MEEFSFDGLGDFVVQKAEKGCVNVEKGVKLGEKHRRGSIAGLVDSIWWMGIAGFEINN